MAKRSIRNTPERHDATGTVGKQTERPSIIHSSLYLLSQFDERLKIHDVVLEGIDY